MSKRNLALFSATMVSVIYGLTFTIAKDVMPVYILPFGFILLRVSGAVVLFWAVSFLGPKRAKKPGIKFEDLPKIDIVLISHSHYDHLDIPTIKKLRDFSNPQIFAGLGMCHYLNHVKNLKINCQEMDWNEKIQFNQKRTIF
jgi:L-ascorbate metabolism protein UlaG (beta-lactamase superfamily)